MLPPFRLAFPAHALTNAGEIVRNIHFENLLGVFTPKAEYYLDHHRLQNSLFFNSERTRSKASFSALAVLSSETSLLPLLLRTSCSNFSLSISLSRRFSSALAFSNDSCNSLIAGSIMRI